MSKWLAFVVGVVLGTSTSLAPATAADSPCGSTLGNYHAGAYSAASTATFGVRADIQYRNPALCDGSSSESFSTAWTMLSPTSPGNAYAQVGYIEVGPELDIWGTGAHGTHFVAQYRDLNDNPRTTITGNVGTATHRYAVYLRASDDRIVMQVDSTVISVMNFDQTGVWSNSWRGQFAAETGHTQSDVPGISGGHARFDGIARYNSTGAQSFITSMTDQAPDSSRYHNIVGPYSSGTGLFLDVWTYPL